MPGHTADQILLAYRVGNRQYALAQLNLLTHHALHEHVLVRPRLIGSHKFIEVLVLSSFVDCSRTNNSVSFI